MPPTTRPTLPNTSSTNYANRPHSDAHRPRWVSQVAVARARGVARSTVSRAVRPGGPLHRASLGGGDRIDAGHPDCVAWVGPVSTPSVYGMPLKMAQELGMIQRPAPPGIEFLDPSRVVTFEQFAELAGLPVAEVPALRKQLADAIPIDFDHPAVQAFLAEQGVTP